MEKTHTQTVIISLVVVAIIAVVAKYVFSSPMSQPISNIETQITRSEVNIPDQAAHQNKEMPIVKVVKIETQYESPAGQDRVGFSLSVNTNG